jgi:uncharacterized protein (DUF427 family)
MKALWNNTVIAESSDTIVEEGNHYFPPDALHREFFTPSSHTSTCSWKGEASYYHLMVEGKENRDAAWYYPSPKAAAAEITGRVAFWRGVVVRP